MKKLILLLLILSLATSGMTQSVVDSPYHINGAAFKENCNCYTLTPAQNTRSGSVWNINKINLNEPFEFSFDVNLGCTDANGADGIVFVLQPISTNVGTTGEGLGFEGIRPSIGIALDTWQNTNLNDPAYDHISIQRDGDNNHLSSNNLDGPVPVSALSENIEDCKWHVLKIRWNANTKVLTTYIDEVLRVSDTIDLVRNVFNNDPMVFWGFTGATGGATNHQRFCTSLTANFNQAPTEETCFPQTIEFVDLSTSFGTIVQWHWDFGDGTTSNLRNPPPHTYAQPGNYTVSSTVLGNNGCWSDTTKKLITIGSIPVADFLVPDTICGSVNFQPLDRSSVEFGTISEWDWIINGVKHSGNIPPLQNISGQSSVDISLSVKTKEGCISEVTTKTIKLLPQPEIEITPLSNSCIGETLQLTASSGTPGNPIQSWNWSPASTTPGDANYSFKPSLPGEYIITVKGIGVNGCASIPVDHIASFFSTNAFAGNDTLVADNQPLQLNASGGVLYSWSPPTGLSDPNIPDPVATLTRETNYVLTAYTPAGCATTDTINIKVYKGPEIYIPNAFSPNSDGHNDRFRYLAVGMRKMNYFRVFNRVGQKIFDGLGFTGWDGTINGIDQPAGNYTFVVSGEDFNGKQIVKKGNFILIR